MIPDRKSGARRGAPLSLRQSAFEACLVDADGPPTDFVIRATEVATRLHALASVAWEPRHAGELAACEAIARAMVSPEMVPDYWYDAPGANDPTTSLRVLAAQVSKRGYWQLAMHVPESLAALCSPETVEGGRILVTRASLCGLYGDDDLAAARAEELLLLSERLHSDEFGFNARRLLAGAAFTHGNVPAAAHHIECARQHAERLGSSRFLAQSAGLQAHLSGTRGDYAAALVHHWECISLSDHPATDAWALANTAETLYRCGHFRASRAARARLLAVKPATSSMATQLGGYAVCCAALKDVAGVRWAAGQVLAIADRSPAQRFLAQGLFGCAQACGQVELMDLAHELHTRGMAMADAKGYHDLRFWPEPVAGKFRLIATIPMEGKAEQALEAIQQWAPDGAATDLVLTTH